MKLFKRTNPFLILFLLISIQVSGQTSSDTVAIHQILEQEALGWNKGDAVEYSMHFAEEGTFTNIMGMFFTGHATFLARHAEILKGMFKDSRFQQEVISLRFLRPDVAVVETLVTVLEFDRSALPAFIHVDKKGSLKTRLVQVMVKNDYRWKIETYHNVDLKAGIEMCESDKWLKQKHQKSPNFGAFLMFNY